MTADIDVRSGTMATLGATLGPNATHATVGHEPGSARGQKPAPLAEGSRIGRFLILRELGEGGMQLLRRSRALSLIQARENPS